MEGPAAGRQMEVGEWLYETLRQRWREETWENSEVMAGLLAALALVLEDATQGQSLGKKGMLRGTLAAAVACMPIGEEE